MFVKPYQYFAELISRNRKRFLYLLTAFFLLSIATFPFCKFSNDLRTILPQKASISKQIEFLGNAAFSNNIIINLRLESDNFDKNELFRASELITSSLDSPLITDVKSGISGKNIKNDYLNLRYHLPAFFDEEALVYAEKATSSEGVHERLKSIYDSVLKSAGAFSSSFIEADPFGLTTGILQKVRHAAGATSYNAKLDDGYFLSKDSREVMIILRTTVKTTDFAESKILLDYLYEKLKILPQHIHGTVICAHNHTVSNSEAIRKDININMIGINIVFLLMIIFVFRDTRSVMIFLLPFLSFPLAINVTSLIHSEVSFFVLGLGALIAGIGVDFGIHAYVAVRFNDNGKHRLSGIVKPLTISVLTTISALFAFYFSSIKGYRQLATFSITSLGLCFFLALFFLPQLLRKRSGNPDYFHKFNPDGFSRGFNSCISLLWLVFIVFFFIFFDKVDYKGDIRFMDGTESHIINEENRFRDVWMNGFAKAMLVVENENFETAVRLNEKFYQKLTANINTSEISSLASVIPSGEIQKNNIERWKRFWSETRIAELKRVLSVEMPVYGFKEGAFSDFFGFIEDKNIFNDSSLPEVSILEELKRLFVLENNGKYNIVTFCNDTSENRKQLSDIADGNPSVFLVSQNELSKGIQETLSSELLRLSIIVATIIFFVVALLLIKPFQVMFSLLPVLTAVCATLAVKVSDGMTPPAIMALVLVIGLSIDYGVFMAFRLNHERDNGTCVGVFLSTLTTFSAACILLFSNHPVLFQFGMALAPGILAGFLTAYFVVPALYNLFQRTGQ